MRPVLTTLSALMLAAAVAQAAEPPSVDPTVAAAIENFQPLWSPPKGQLSGWIVGIDPAETHLAPPAGRLCDDLSLITAAHLYHFVRRADGWPVLTRRDDTHVGDADRAGLLADAGCGLCVSIRYAEVGGKVSTRRGSPNAHPQDAALAGELSAALHFQLAQPDPAATNSGLIEALGQVGGAGGIPFCEVCFGCPPGTSTIEPGLRKVCLDNARRLYEGIGRACTQLQRPAASDKPVPDPLSSSSGSRLERVARSIWPDGRLPNERIDWFCREFAEQSITNHSLVCFEVSAQLEQDVVILRGRSNAPLVAAGLAKTLRVVGLAQVDNRVRTLPDRQSLGEDLFGVCRAPMAVTYDGRQRGARPQTQLLFGEPLFLLDREEESYLLHAGDGYWGWVHRDAVQPMTAERFDAYLRHPRGTVLKDIESERVRIPRGSNVRVVRTTEDEHVILLPDGSTLTVPAATVTVCDPEGWQAGARAHAALDLLYTPYVFGGRSPLGLDCSGLVSNVWSRLGVTPPRDARQQAPGGRLVATHWHRTNIQPGDQLFLINESGKIYHTGIVLDAAHVIHATAPCVQIGSFDPQDPLYDPELDRNFFMVKRP